MNLDVPYPHFEAELKIAQLSRHSSLLTTIPQAEILLQARKMIEEVPINHFLLEGIVRIVRNTRPQSSKLSLAQEYLEFGASPRATQALLIASKAAAVIAGSAEVEFEHIASIAPAVLRHRCVTNLKSLSEKRSSSSIIHQIVKETVL